MQVVDAYAAVVLAKARVQVLTRSRERAQETYKLLDRDFTAGKGMKSDVLMAKATLKSLEPLILTAARDADAARRNFNRLLGRDASDVTELDTLGVLAQVDNDPLPDRDAAIARAIQNRADLQSLQVAARVYEGTSKIFQANYYPTIGYSGKFGIMAYEPDQMVSWTHRQWQIGVGLTWTIFDGLGKDGANKALVAQWKSDARVFQFQASELQRGLEIEVDGALRDCMAADTSLVASMEGRDAATEAVTLLKNMYPGGAIRLADILSAEDGLRNAELSVLSARFARIRAIAKLRLAQGQDLIIVSEEK
jgi:outer membrane protein TolC